MRSFTSLAVVGSEQWANGLKGIDSDKAAAVRSTPALLVWGEKCAPRMSTTSLTSLSTVSDGSAPEDSQRRKASEASPDVSAPRHAGMSWGRLRPRPSRGRSPGREKTWSSLGRDTPPILTTVAGSIRHCLASCSGGGAGGADHEKSAGGPRRRSPPPLAVVVFCLGAASERDSIQKFLRPDGQHVRLCPRPEKTRLAAPHNSLSSTPPQTKPATHLTCRSRSPARFPQYDRSGPFIGGRRAAATERFVVTSCTLHD